MKIRNLIAVIFAAAFIFPAVAIERITDNLLLFSGDFDVHNREHRKKAARFVLASVDRLNAYIPELNDGQRNWLRHENDSLKVLSGNAYVEKFYAIEYSSEYQVAEIKSVLSGMKVALECILNDSVSLSLELYCWNSLVYYLYLDDYNSDAVIILNRNKYAVFSEEIKKELTLDYSKENPFGGWKLVGRGIQKNIILPLLSESAR